MLKKEEGQTALGPGTQVSQVATGNVVIIRISQEKVAEALQSDMASDLSPKTLLSHWCSAVFSKPAWVFSNGCARRRGQPIPHSYQRQWWQQRH